MKVKICKNVHVKGMHTVYTIVGVSNFAGDQNHEKYYYQISLCG